jgi:hypothetical protein
MTEGRRVTLPVSHWMTPGPLPLEIVGTHNLALTQLRPRGWTRKRGRRRKRDARGRCHRTREAGPLNVGRVCMPTIGHHLALLTKRPVTATTHSVPPPGTTLPNATVIGMRIVMSVGNILTHIVMSVTIA